MSLWTIVLIIVIVLVVLGLLAWAVQRKKKQQARIRADELRSKAADTHTDVHLQDAKAREAEAEAQRARAQADRLEAQAREERIAHEQVRAQQEDHLREADRLDPDVDHSGADRPVEGGSTSERPVAEEPPGRHQG